MGDNLRLYSYWRSSAAYRVRIGLNLKGLEYEIVPVHLLQDGGQQHADGYRAINPQELVPTLLHGQRRLTQSLSILEYLDEIWPDNPLLPATARERQRARSLAQLIACDIHPLNNLRVLQYLDHQWHVPQPDRDDWIRHWIEVGFRVLQEQLHDHPSTGTFCDGDTPGISDCCLIPQVYNARRCGIDMGAYPAIVRIEKACLALPEFDDARPENQPDAP
ncbi:MAG: maleylacetoacetate isomerase [Thermomonas sp.]|uniref:maleylacetoacetate isomerase n=1 Tax=Thermomonas sp. TaxID=1971895 RepID=UPI0026361B48|nr:maleylacetoacetate isomerase [Thermomonas sp.]MCC7096764.1 maleylacetoacetate isomerase [Thermomonas sp.]